MKKVTLSLLFISAVLIFSKCTLSKLTIKNEDGKFKIKEQMTVAITSNEQEVYPFNESCKSTCKECDPLFQSARKIVDTIQSDYFVLRRNLAFRYDTIPQKEYKMRHSKEKKTNLHVVLSINKRPWYVYKIPTEMEIERYRYDELGTITYSYKAECYHGGPFQKMFADPNKIRRVKIKDAIISTKIR